MPDSSLSVLHSPYTRRKDLSIRKLGGLVDSVNEGQLKTGRLGRQRGLTQAWRGGEM